MEIIFNCKIGFIFFVKYKSRVFFYENFNRFVKKLIVRFKMRVVINGISCIWFEEVFF